MRDSTSKELNEFLRRFGALLQDYARQGLSTKLKASLERLQRIVETWVRLAPDTAVGTLPTLWRSPTESFAGPLAVDLHDTIERAVESRRADTCDVLLSFLQRLALLGVEHSHVYLLHEICGLLTFFYYQAAKQPELDRFTTEHFDTLGYYLLSRFDSRHTRQGASEDEHDRSFATNRPCLDQALRCILSLIRAAVQLDRTEDVEQFIDRVFDYEQHTPLRARLHRRAPTHEDCQTLHEYVKMIVIGWALTWIDHQGDKPADAAVRALQITLGNLPPPYRLVALWELYHGKPKERRLIDERLGVTHWDPKYHEHFRVGKAFSGFVDDRWIERGWHAAMLRAGVPHTRRLSEYFAEPAPRGLWDPDRTREWAGALAARAEIALPAENQDEAIENVTTIVRNRQLFAELAYMQRLIHATIVAPSLERFRKAIRATLSEHDHYAAAIESLAPLREARMSPWPRPRAAFAMPRDCFIEGGSAAAYAKWVAGELARHHAMCIMWPAEQLCDRGPDVAALASLRESVRNAAAVLNGAGYHPNLVVLPAHDRFACALHDRPLWEVKGCYGL